MPEEVLKEEEHNLIDVGEEKGAEVDLDSVKKEEPKRRLL